MGSESTTAGSEVDTGPGLEAHTSWDYSHLKSPPPSKRPPVGPPYLDDASGGARVAVGATGNTPNLAREHSGNHASTSQRGGGGRVDDGEEMRSAFQGASRVAAPVDPSDQGPPPMQQAPERAETVEEKDLRVRAEKRAKRTEQTAQVTSLATLSLLLIASSLFLFLTYTGWNVVAAACALFCASIAGYPSLTLLWYALSSQMFGCWRKLEAWERFKWGQKGASVVHSAIMASVGASVMLRGDWKGANMIHSTDERVAAFIGLEIGYLLQDWIHHPSVGSLEQDTGMEIYTQLAFGKSFGVLHWIHHLLILTSLPWYYKYFKADFFFGASFLWTTSTLPLQLRWFQETSGVRRGVMYQLNNLALLLSFLACRICIVPYLMHTYGVMKGGLSLYQVAFRIPRSLLLVGVGLMSINLFWLVKLLRHAFTPFSRRPRNREKAH